MVYYVEDSGITSSAAGLSGTLQGSGSAYSLDTTSITIVDKDGNASNPTAISGFTITDAGALTFDPTHADYDGLALQETIQISGTYNYTDTDSAAASNQFIITITTDGTTRSATYLSGSDTPNSSLGAYGFTPDQDFNGTAKFSYLVKDGQGGSVSNTVPVVIDSRNDAPEALYQEIIDGSEGSSEISGQLTSFDIDTRNQDGTADESASYAFVSALIDDPTVVYTNNGFSGTITTNAGDAIASTQEVSFTSLSVVNGSTSTSAASIADVADLSLNAANGSWELDTTGAPYNALTDGQSIDISGTYEILNTGDSSLVESRPFRIRVSATTVDGAIQLTEQFAIGFDSSASQGVSGLQIDADGAWRFDPTNSSYQQLSAGDFQEIEVTYSVTDADTSSDTNNFTIRLSGTNDAPNATFDTDQTVAEDANNGIFTQTAFGNATGTLSGYFGTGQTFAFESATASNDGGATSSALTAVGGLAITSTTGALVFDPTHTDYDALTSVGDHEVSMLFMKLLLHPVKRIPMTSRLTLK